MMIYSTYTWDLAPDPKCKLNISSFLTLPYPLDCLICANDIMIIVSLHMMGDGKVGGGGGGGWFNYVKVWVGGQGVGITVFLFFVFVLLLIVLSGLVHDSCFVCFLVSFLLSLSLIPLIRSY